MLGDVEEQQLKLYQNYYGAVNLNCGVMVNSNN